MTIWDDPVSLGWGPFFEKQVRPEEKDSCLAARVIAVHKYAFTLAHAGNVLSAVIAGKVLHGLEPHADLPVVGDWVLAKPPVGGTAVISRVLDRRSMLSRRRPLDRNASKISAERQVLASNLDYVFIVMSLNHDLNPARLERALTMVWNSGATPVVLLSKADLCPDAEDKSLAIQSVATGVSVHVFSSRQACGLPVIREYFKAGITGCLIGSSGVGKTTLINALCETHYKVLPIREDDDKGRHATTVRSLFFLPQGGMIIDTPGLREIGLMEDSDLSATFADVAGLAMHCRFHDCTHQGEPGCSVLAALNDGRLTQERYGHYLKLRRELEYQESKHSLVKQQDAKKKEKQLGRIIKDYFKNNPR